MNVAAIGKTRHLATPLRQMFRHADWFVDRATGRI